MTASVQAHKILVLVPFNGKSHWNYMSVFVKELLDRGHEVTTVTSISMGSKLNNYTEILIDPPYDWLTKSKISFIFLFNTARLWLNTGKRVSKKWSP